ncbi:hypothetical protein ACTWQB_01010 [Piscibacillus sp. B03]|uniref:hypothetical protein n=1 Tax=Piscibacillus sp. B03 TaxID=3457430 RepID=UPI003FCC4D88
MFRSEKGVKRLFLFLMIFAYVIYIPVTLVELINGTAAIGSVITAVVLGVGLPIMRKRYLNTIKENDYNHSA